MKIAQSALPRVDQPGSRALHQVIQPLSLVFAPAVVAQVLGIGRAVQANDGAENRAKVIGLCGYVGDLVIYVQNKEKNIIG